MSHMKRQTAIDAFGSVAKLAAALTITRQAVYQWPDDLPLDYADRVRGAAVRCGIVLPATATPPKLRPGGTAHQEVA